MEEQILQLEEQQKNMQQRRDEDPYDPNSPDRFPDGYTPVGEGTDNTGVEQAPSIDVGEVQVSASIDSSNPPLESYGSSGDEISVKITPEEAYNAYGISMTPVNPIDFNNATLDNLFGIDSSFIDNSSDPSGPVREDDEVDPPVDPPVPPVDPPVDPPLPPVDPEDPDPEDPDPEDPDPEDPDPEDPDPEDPDPEDPDPEDPDPEDPDPEDPDPEDPDPEDPDPEDPDPEDPDPEDPGKGNPGNDKEVGNSPWDGETGASNNPGKGNNQDGQDPETNQPPGDAKNDGGQGNNPQNDNDNGGGRGNPTRGENNGFGNGDDDAPGNSLIHNNAENNQTSDSDIGILIDKFVEENPGTEWHDHLNIEHDHYEPEYVTDVNIPDAHEPSIYFDGYDDFTNSDSYE